MQDENSAKQNGIFLLLNLFITLQYIIVPIHTKREKQNVKNYRPVFALPICDKIFERLTFNEMFNHFSANKLIPKSQTGFQSSDFCINQLLSISHKSFTFFYN